MVFKLEDYGPDGLDIMEDIRFGIYFDPSFALLVNCFKAVQCIVSTKNSIISGYYLLAWT